MVDLEAMTRTQLLEYAKNSNKTREDLSKTAAEDSSRRVRFDEDLRRDSRLSGAADDFLRDAYARAPSSMAQTS